MWLKGIKFDRLASGTVDPVRVAIPLPGQEHLEPADRAHVVIRANNGFSAVTRAAAVLRQHQKGQVPAFADEKLDPYAAIITEAMAFNENANLVREKALNPLGLEISGGPDTDEQA